MIIFRLPSNCQLLRRNVQEGVGVPNTNLMLLLLCLFQRKVCASLSALGEVQLLEAITFPPGERRGHFAQIVCNQINKEDKVQRRKCMPVGHTGEICDPVFPNYIYLFLSLQSWCGCLRTGGDQALDLQPYSGGLILKTKHAVAMSICIPPSFS